MIMKTLTSIALVAGCAVGQAAPMAQAQTDTQTGAPRILVGTEADRFLDLSLRSKAESGRSVSLSTMRICARAV